jgi:hypothetical protein
MMHYRMTRCSDDKGTGKKPLDSGAPRLDNPNFYQPQCCLSRQGWPVMNPALALPAGIRLDVWPNLQPAPEPADTQEVADLKAELRRSMPEVAAMLDIMVELRPVQDLVGRLAGAPMAQTAIESR